MDKQTRKEAKMVTIDKVDFERALPVGASSHEEVYLSVQGAIGEQLVCSTESLLGEAGEKMVDAAENDSPLVLFFKKYVCLSAFLSVLRQLDLVLTPTGFGIVSNDNLSPASKQRVDALDGLLRTERMKALSMTVNLLRSEDWGKTDQAKRYVPYLYDAYAFFFSATPYRTYQDWTAFQGAIEGTDDVLREAMGDEQMETLIDAFRRADASMPKVYTDVQRCVVALTEKYAVSKDVRGTGLFIRSASSSLRSDRRTQLAEWSLPLSYPRGRRVGRTPCEAAPASADSRRQEL